MSESTYAWIIDKDHLDDGKTGDRAGTTGPHDAPDALLARLAGSEHDLDGGARFQMYDDDGELYYAGRLVCLDQEEEVIKVDSELRPGYRIRLVVQSPGDEQVAFGPLWDFGGPDSGCTEIRYRDTATKVWGSL